MRIEFNYTFDDLKELMVPEIYVADARKYRRRRILNLASWAVICAIIGGSIWVANLIQQGATTGNQPQDLVVELLPSALPAAFACAAVCLGAWENWRKSRARQDPAQPALRRGKVTR